MSGRMRRIAKAAVAGVMHYSGMRTALATVRRHRAGGRRILIVSYHRVVDDFTGELQRSIPGLLISKETFQRHLEEAHRAGYAFATLGEALEVMSGKRKAARDLCVVTFDDGYRDVYRWAFPILKKMGIPATIYLPALYVGTERRFDHDRLFHLIRLLQETGQEPLYETLPPWSAGLIAPVLQGLQPLSGALDDFIGYHRGAMLRATIDGLERQLGAVGPVLPVQGDVMDWDEVREMAGQGISFGAHTLHHTVLTLEPRDDVRREIRESKAIIEKEVGQPVEDFAYCNGWYSDVVIRELREAGFRSAVTTEDLANVIGGDPFTLKRKVLWENFSSGMDGAYSSALTRCQLDDVFGTLGVNNPVAGRRSQMSLPPFEQPTLQPEQV
ncbi:MAG TPA: polysaccharide deacetylase family protein [Myxococcaceae bacterium]|nr:polysaccharide deacetylase family protein [Myxococcaceae bacterium]